MISRSTNLMIFASVVLLCTFSKFSSIAADPVKVEPIKVQITTDRQDALYKCGEKATFNCTVMNNDQPLTSGKISVRISNDGLKTMFTQEVDLAKSNSCKIESTMKVPGFLRCEVKFDKIKGYAAAGFEPEKIQPAAPMPEDFKKFWADGIKELDKIPLDVKLEPLPKFSTPQFDCFKISFANIDNTRIYGFLSVPKDKKGLFPALVAVPGAGPGYCAPDTGWVKSGVIVLLMNVHQYDPPTDEKAIRKVYAELNKSLLYSLQGAPDRDKYYYKKSILGINRAINWLAERPDVDKKHFVMCGKSQGGAFTLIMSGLNKNITAASAAIPALCDHAGYKLDRKPGWPSLLIRNGTENIISDSLKMSGYFDAVNFARDITCPIIVSVGFIDTTCSPSSVYAAYNSIQSTKTINNEPTMGHDYSPRFGLYQNEWLKSKLGLTKESK